MAVYNDGTGKKLYAGGAFTPAGGVTENSIAAWNGLVWSDLNGLDDTGWSSATPLP